MFDRLIKTALKSVLENPVIKERIKEKINEAGKTEKNQVRGKIINLGKNNYKVVE